MTTATLPDVHLTVIVPTIARASLLATLASIAAGGVGQGDEVLVVPDGPTSARASVDQAIEASGLIGQCGVKLIYPSTHLGHWGHGARNMAMMEAAGTHVVSIDDDDVYEPAAIEDIRAMIQGAPSRVHIWRMAHRSGVLWIDEALRQGNVGTPMFGVPRAFAGQWGSRYEGDYDYIHESLAKSGQPPVWHPVTLVRCG